MCAYELIGIIFDILDISNKFVTIYYQLQTNLTLKGHQMSKSRSPYESQYIIHMN